MSAESDYGYKAGKCHIHTIRNFVLSHYLLGSP